MCLVFELRLGFIWFLMSEFQSQVQPNITNIRVVFFELDEIQRLDRFLYVSS